MVAALLVGAAGWFGVRLVLGTPVGLEVDGRPIVSAGQMLDDANPLFESLAAEDGAPLVEDGRCWLAPAADTGQPAASDSGPGWRADLCAWRLLFTSSRRFPRSRRNLGPLVDALRHWLAAPEVHRGEAWLR